VCLLMSQALTMSSTSHQKSEETPDCYFLYLLFKNTFKKKMCSLYMTINSVLKRNYEQKFLLFSFPLSIFYQQADGE
jgi:hypothetical protein